MTEQSLNIKAGEFALTFPEKGKYSTELRFQGELVAAIGRCVCGKFSETNALGEYLRLHPAQDGKSAQAESLGVIPFGCEYEVRRDTQFCSGALRTTTDVAAVNFGRIGDLVMENWEIPVCWKSLEFTVYGQKSVPVQSADLAGEKLLYCGVEPLLLLRAITENGAEVEFACGPDLWRHRAAQKISGCTAKYTLTASPEKVVLERQVLIYEPETEPEKRPWRFKMLCSWQKVQSVGGKSGFDREFELKGCAGADTARRMLRKAVRKSEGMALLLTGASPEICTDPSHVDRPGKGELEHWDLEEHLVSYIWGNRQLEKTGGKLCFAPFGGTFAGTTLSKVLGRTPEALDFGDME